MDFFQTFFRRKITLCLFLKHLLSLHTHGFIDGCVHNMKDPNKDCLDDLEEKS